MRRWIGTHDASGCSAGSIEIIASMDGGPFEVLETGGGGGSGCESTGAGAGTGSAGPVVAVARPACAAGAIALHDLDAGTTQTFDWSDPSHYFIHDIRVAGPYVAFEADSCCTRPGIVVVIDRRTEAEVYRASIAALGEPYAGNSLVLQDDGAVVIAIQLVSSPDTHGLRLAWASPASPVLQVFGPVLDRPFFDYAAGRIAYLRESEPDFVLMDVPAGTPAPFAWMRDPGLANGVAWDGHRLAWITEGALHNEPYPHDPGPKPSDEPVGWGSGPQRRLTAAAEPVPTASFGHALVADPRTGQGLAAWIGYREGAAGAVRTRRIDADGKPAGPERAISSGGAAVLALARGARGVLAAWVTKAQAGAVRVRRLDAGGRPRGPGRTAVRAIEEVPALALAVGVDRRAVLAVGSKSLGPAGIIATLRIVPLDANGKPGRVRTLAPPAGATRTGVDLAIAALAGG
ncbi:MAG TPA: hypothetical protein VFR49_10090, partial [Solirubrobacteraceae bacterium]|nr:hypothetical protein [Solirubrobacteraceae bacterium]